MKVAIVDYGLGNLYSIQQACEYVDFQAVITSRREALWAADAVILPGVGAFGRAMESLGELDLVSPLRDMAASGKPFVGICLGLQLLMTESHEFGQHRGLGIIEGEVVGLRDSGEKGLKVPHVGWEQITYPKKLPDRNLSPGPWESSPLEGLSDGTYMYFIHSYYAKPENADIILAVSSYGGVEFCCSLRVGNVFATQFHPERSGVHGLHIYRQLAYLLQIREE